jgi:hypothetical protein
MAPMTVAMMVEMKAMVRELSNASWRATLFQAFA